VSLEYLEIFQKAAATGGVWHRQALFSGRYNECQTGHQTPRLLDAGIKPHQTIRVEELQPGIPGNDGKAAFPRVRLVQCPTVVITVDAP
jgi:hypothetical protein